MKSKTILVTGGAGFIGSHLVERLARRNRVVVVDMAVRRGGENVRALRKVKGVKLLGGDIRNVGFLRRIFDQFEFDSMVHLAAKAGVRKSQKFPKMYASVNVMGTINLLEMIKDKRCQLVFASSSSVYGKRNKGPFRESDPLLAATSVYAATKQAGESLVMAYADLYEIPTTILRFFTAFGPRNRKDMACYMFTDAIMKGRKITQFGDGRSSRDYTYVTDVVRGIERAVAKPFEMEVINLGNSKPTRLTGLIRTIENKTGKKALINKVEMPKTEMKLTFASVKKSKKLLGWEPKVSLGEGIEKLVRWYRQSYENNNEKR